MLIDRDLLRGYRVVSPFEQPVQGPKSILKVTPRLLATEGHQLSRSVDDMFVNGPSTFAEH